MESGGDVRKGVDHQDGDFWPDHTTQYPKVEREIHAAVWSFLTQVAATPVAAPGTPPAPAPPPSGSSSSGGCLSAVSLPLLWALRTLSMATARPAPRRRRRGWGVRRGLR
jgi:hypothetical protein